MLVPLCIIKKLLDTQPQNDFKNIYLYERFWSWTYLEPRSFPWGSAKTYTQGPGLPGPPTAPSTEPAESGPLDAKLTRESSWALPGTREKARVARFSASSQQQIQGREGIGSGKEHILQEGGNQGWTGGLLSSDIGPRLSTKPHSSQRDSLTSLAYSQP